MERKKDFAEGVWTKLVTDSWPPVVFWHWWAPLPLLFWLSLYCSPPGCHLGTLPKDEGYS